VRSEVTTRAFAAIVLAGGGSSRLGGVDKLRLTGPDGRTALEAAVAACAGAIAVVVVGPSAGLPGVVATCEDPPGTGPARALAAGVAALGDIPDDALPVLVLAGDLPRAEAAVRALRAAWGAAGDGVIAVAGGRRQWLLGLYRLGSLRAACAALGPWQPGQRGESVRDLLDGLSLADVPVAAEDAADLDTWDDVARAGYAAIDNGTRKGDGMDEFEVVDGWFTDLRDHLDLAGLEAPDWQELLDTVRATAHGVIHAAGPVTAFAVGYAAAKGDGSAAATSKLLAAARDALPEKAA